MKRLRLLKPWRLRIQPQRLACPDFDAVFTGALRPCTGPLALDEEALLRTGAETLCCQARFESAAASLPAAPPAPRAIFAPATNERYRS